jgi:hypothetical protein
VIVLACFLLHINVVNIFHYGFRLRRWLVFELSEVAEVATMHRGGGRKITLFSEVLDGWVW